MIFETLYLVDGAITSPLSQSNALNLINFFRRFKVSLAFQNLLLSIVLTLLSQHASQNYPL
ncbi:MAG: hypothetical protein DCF22_10635 [Leptolyngbya sp.]|nr:MAG: hypothetical protein DCF22_10635 [Leptolyngbya sp.]